MKSEVKPQIKSTDSTSRHSDRTPNPVNRSTYVGKGVQSANAISIDNNYSPTSDESTVASVTLKPPMVSAEHPAVWFSLGKYVYKTLLDKCIDKKLIPECNLNVIPVAGKIKLSQEGNTADRIGITDPLSITAIFPVPSISLGSIPFTHQFEIMSLDSSDYRFIIGKDLIPILVHCIIDSTFDGEIEIP